MRKMHRLSDCQLLCIASGPPIILFCWITSAHPLVQGVCSGRGMSVHGFGLQFCPRYRIWASILLLIKCRSKNWAFGHNPKSIGPRLQPPMRATRVYGSHKWAKTKHKLTLQPQGASAVAETEEAPQEEEEEEEKSYGARVLLPQL